MRRTRSTATLPTTLCGAAWKIAFALLPDRGKNGAWGLCHHDRNEVQIDPRVFDPKIVAEYQEHVTAREIALHEALHAQMPWMAEPVIDRMAKELDDYLELLDL